MNSIFYDKITANVPWVLKCYDYNDKSLRVACKWFENHKRNLAKPCKYMYI